MDYYQRIKESFDQQTFFTLIGAVLEEADLGRVVISCRRRPDLLQQQGFLHGGVITSIADSTCGYTALTMMPEGYEVLTVEFKINILRAVRGDQIIATGSVVRAGKRLVITEAVVREPGSEEPVAKMLATMIPVPVENAEQTCGRN